MQTNTLKLITICFSLFLIGCSRLPNEDKLLPASLSDTQTQLITTTVSTNNTTVSNNTEAATATNTSAPATATPSPTPTKPNATPTPTRVAPTPQPTPNTIITVNTFEPEVFPFKKNGNCSLGEAIWAAQTQLPQDGCKAGGADGTTIILNSGIYTFTQADTKSTIVLPDINLPQPASALAALPVIGGQIAIIGNNSTLMRVGPQAFRFFDVYPSGSLTLNNLTLMGGDPGKLDGGAIQNLGQTNLISITLRNNNAYDGGAIANLNETQIVSSLFISNGARHYGGALYGEGGLFALRDSQLISNTATEVGGAVYGVRSKFEFEHSIFDSNASVLGGAIYNEDSNLILNDASIVSNNRATQDMGKAAFAYGGGGIVSFGTESVVTIENSKLIGNRANKSSGGALTNWSGSVAITRTIISGNVATVAGAVLDGYFGGVTTIADGCVLNNESLRETAQVVAFTKIPLDASNNWWGSENGPPLPRTPTPTITPTPSNTPTPRPTRTPTATPKTLTTPAATATDVMTPTPTRTPSPSVITSPYLSEAPDICR